MRLAEAKGSKGVAQSWYVYKEKIYYVSPSSLSLSLPPSPSFALILYHFPVFHGEEQNEDCRQSDGWIGIIGSLRFAIFHTHRPNNNLGGGGNETKKKPAHDTHDTHDVFFSSAHRRLTSLSLPTLPYYLAQAATVSLPAEVRMQAVKVVPAACIITLL